MNNKRIEKVKNKELTEDLKNDLLLSFNLFKGSNGMLNKLKLRSMLFSFAMYKSAPADINKFIHDHYHNKEEFSFEDLCHLVEEKMNVIRERDFEDTWFLICNGRHHSSNKDDLSKALKGVGIETSDKEIHEMIDFINQYSNSGSHHSPDTFNKEDLKKFMES